MEGLQKHKLVIIGGAEDKKGRKVILKDVCNLIDKEKDELLVVTVASEVQGLVSSDYKKVFEEIGVKNLRFLNMEFREEAYKEENIKKVKNAKLIFFTGGDQLRVTSLIGGSPIEEELNNSKDKVIVGTSAGASVMSSTMILSGDDEEAPSKKTVSMSAGLGLLTGVIIDQHFSQRGRIGRLISAISENPSTLGIGIDENTAIIVSREKKIKAIGEGAVYIIDGKDITYSNVWEEEKSRTFSIFNIKLHLLNKGDVFDLEKRIPFEEEVIKNEDN
ncbi:cyanophycinase [Clostridium chrysemydis]|uniref:cyanophycinase n=1 Tax=Clostridium chrysemydis TaxID=2665504 RepID=UPI0018838E38|nr:cyanophycinase [Clostridium chrysemydis]